MARLNRIGVLFAGKLAALLMAGPGLIAGVFYAFGGAVYDLANGSLNAGTALAFMALIGMPALSSVLGFVAGTVGAGCYNFFAAKTGGLKLDIEHDDRKA